MKRSQSLVKLALGALLLTLLASGCGADSDFRVSRLTKTDSDEWRPQVSDDRVVWSALDGSLDGRAIDEEVFTWTPTDGVLRITDNDVYDVMPRVSGDRVVWMSGRDVGTFSDYEIFSWTPAEGVVQLTDNDYPDMRPEVSGDRVVWRAIPERSGVGVDIMTWTPAEGDVLIATGAYEVPRVSGERVVWEGYREGDVMERDIFTWTPDGGVIQLTDLDTVGAVPHVSGDRVVWSGPGGVFTWTPTGGTVVLTSDPGQGGPLVSGDRVVWDCYLNDDDGSQWGVFTWTPIAGMVRVVSGDYGVAGISGDRVILARYGSDSYLEVFTWVPALGTEGTILKITDNADFSWPPEVSGDRVVWTAYDGRNRDVFTAKCYGLTD